jgi:hypothetical protein
VGITNEKKINEKFYFIELTQVFYVSTGDFWQFVRLFFSSNDVFTSDESGSTARNATARILTARHFF